VVVKTKKGVPVCGSRSIWPFYLSFNFWGGYVDGREMNEHEGLNVFQVKWTKFAGNIFVSGGT